MTKLLVCAANLLMASHILCAQDTTARLIVPKTRMLYDTSKKSSDTALAKPASYPILDSSKHDETSTKKSGDIKLVVDKSDPAEVGSNQDFDPRWFISPLFKFQYQDYGMLEKNHFGYQSNANSLSMLDKGNISASLSAYKNISSRFSASADVGLAYGHVTSTDVLVGTTRPGSYNVLDLTAYYHLLPGRYKLQPFVSIGIHDLISNASYLTAPIGVGMKFHSRKIAILGQAAYGYGVSKNNASTVMYTLCVYVPVNFKKKKPEPADALSKMDAVDKKADSLAKKNKSDSTLKKDKDSATNENVTINMDSVMKAKNSRAGKDSADNDGVNGKNGKAKKDGYDDEFNGTDDSDNPNAKTGTGAKKGLKVFNYDDFSVDDFEVDTIDGKPVVKFVVYFEFNQYDLNSSAFARIDKVIARLHNDKNLMISIKGYTDNVGTNEFNMMLSKKRAQIVFQYMNSRAITSDRMTSRFYGKENPVADNTNPNTAWLNRRAEIYIYEKGTTVPNVILPQAKYLRK